MSKSQSIICLFLFFISSYAVGSSMLIEDIDELWVQGDSYFVDVTISDYHGSKSVTMFSCSYRLSFSTVNSRFSSIFDGACRGNAPSSYTTPLTKTLKIKVPDDLSPGSYPLQIKFVSDSKFNKNTKNNKKEKPIFSQKVMIDVISSRQTLAQVRERLMSKSQKTRLRAVRDLERFGKRAEPLLKWALARKDLGRSAYHLSKKIKCTSCEPARKKFFELYVKPGMLIKGQLNDPKIQWNFLHKYNLYKPYTYSMLPYVDKMLLSKGMGVKYRAAELILENEPQKKNYERFTKMVMAEIDSIESSFKRKKKYESRGIDSHFLGFITKLPKKYRLKVLRKALGIESIRPNFISLVGRTKDIEFEDILINTLKSENSALRYSAARSLGEVKSTKSIPFLMQNLKKYWETYVPYDSQPSFRGYAQALYEIGNTQAFNALSFYRNDLIQKLRQQNRLQAAGKRLRRSPRGVFGVKMFTGGKSQEPKRDLKVEHVKAFSSTDQRTSLIYNLSQLREFAVPAIGEIRASLNKLGNSDVRKVIGYLMMIPHQSAYDLMSQYPAVVTNIYMANPCKKGFDLPKMRSYTNKIIQIISKSYKSQISTKDFMVSRFFLIGLDKPTSKRECLVKDLKSINSPMSQKLLQKIFSNSQSE